MKTKIKKKLAISTMMRSTFAVIILVITATLSFGQNIPEVKKIDSIKQKMDSKFQSFKTAGAFNFSEIEVLLKYTTEDIEEKVIRLDNNKDADKYTLGKTFYYKLKDNDTRVRLICYDQNNMNDLAPQHYVYTYYFDNLGKTICYVRSLKNFIDGEENEIRYYNSNGKQIKSKCSKISIKGIKSQVNCDNSVPIEMTVIETDSALVTKWGLKIN